MIEDTKKRFDKEFAEDLKNETHKRHVLVWNDVENITLEKLNIKTDGYNDEKYSDFLKVWNRDENMPIFAQIENLKKFKEFVKERVKEKDFRVERYRSMYIYKQYIGIRARIGGGNKEDYYYCYKILERHPLFIGCRNLSIEDGWDDTYCLFFFEFPQGIKRLLKKFSILEEAYIKAETYEKKLEYVKKMEDIIKKYKTQIKKNLKEDIQK